VFSSRELTLAGGTDAERVRGEVVTDRYSPGREGDRTPARGGDPGRESAPGAAASSAGS
jgi:hypothetical protein